MIVVSKTNFNLFTSVTILWMCILHSQRIAKVLHYEYDYVGDMFVYNHYIYIWCVYKDTTCGDGQGGAQVWDVCVCVKFSGGCNSFNKCLNNDKKLCFLNIYLSLIHRWWSSLHENIMCEHSTYRMFVSNYLTLFALVSGKTK